VLAAILTVTALTGCVTTQRESARLGLVAARTIASSHSVLVRRANPAIRVTGIWRVGSGALVVGLRNLSVRPLTDVPISVGLTVSPHRRVLLNRAPNLDYFSTHIPAIGAGATVQWVFAPGHGIASGRPFAVVGEAGSPPAGNVETLPQIEVSAVGSGSERLRVSVVSHSRIPQYNLPIYVTAARRGRPVAAGTAIVKHIGTLGRTVLTLKLMGSLRGATVHGFALPTIFE
jgi:hypothetical protein